MFKTLWHESIERLSINFLQWHVTLIAKFTSFDETQHSVTVDIKALEGPLAAHSPCSLFHGAGASCLSEDHSGIRDGCDIHFSHLCHSSKKKTEILHPQVIEKNNYFANAAAIRASWGTVQVLKTDWQLPASAAPSDLIPASIIFSSSALSKFSSNKIRHQQGFVIAKYWWTVRLLPTQVSPASGNLESPSFCISVPLQLRQTSPEAEHRALS